MNKNKIFIIAEAGVNHNGSLKNALELVRIAKKCGADAVKFQLFNMFEQISKNAPTAPYQKKRTRKKNMLEMARSYNLDWNEHVKIKNYCRSLKIEYMASCFDIKSVDFYKKKLKANQIKIASSEIDNHKLLKYINKKFKKVILSTGMADLNEINKARKLLNKVKHLVIMQCTSLYPTPIEDLNLIYIDYFKKKFNLEVGLSDHTRSNIPSLVSLGLGAKYLEKHFTISKTLKGPDHSMSLNPAELKKYINNIRIAEKCFGNINNKPTSSEKKIIKFSRRGLFSSKFLRKGKKINLNDLVYKRPASFMSIGDEKQILGKRINKNLMSDQPILKKYFKT